MNNKKLFLCFIVLLLLGFFIFSANISLAADTIINKLKNLPPDINCSKLSGYNDEQLTAAKQYCGDYELNDFARVAINISTWILGIVGSLTLLFFIYGGVTFLISSGKQEMVTKAKQIILGAVLGLIIVFTSYMIISFVAQALGIEHSNSILQSNWFDN